MKMTRLRLLGFKSFVEPQEIIIEGGLTGVVGPNGCGKSNLLEALRWAMGETSHKSMRAAAMDDVIFAGTTHRPARNWAEVTITIDNSERQAPAEFNDSDVIEITRRIEREAGSAYRINGREARARDVKLLFEDAATGARSPALVRQGQIGEIVNAKPEQRRRILEDAAGVAGLASRRHEAELRLNAAEANLARVGDVLGGLTTQVEALKRQARAARRYKEISAEIRKTEALAMHLAWGEAQGEVETGEARLGECLVLLGEAVAAESRAVTEETELAQSIQPLRDDEAVRGVVLARLKHEQTAFEKEAERAAERRRELEARAGQLETDIAREHQLVAEAREALTRLEAEIALLGEGDEDDGGEESARARFAQAEQNLAKAEQRFGELTHRAAEQRARRNSLVSGLGERREAVQRLERQLASLDAQLREAAARAPDAVKLQAITREGHDLAAAITAIEAAAGAAEEQLHALTEATKLRRDEAAKARLDAEKLATERATLAKLLIPARDPEYPPVVDSLAVTPGYEAALGAALGDDLDAPLSTQAPVHWRLIEAQSEDAALPADAEPLDRAVEAPEELRRRLKQIGVVTSEMGVRLQPHLKPGQRLVSKAGDLWRWDGYVAAAHGTSAAAVRLAERNRLAELERREAQARARAEDLAEAEAAAAAIFREAETEERELRLRWRDAQARLTATRTELTQIERAARETEARLATLGEARERASDDLVDAHERLSEMETTLELMSDDDVADEALGAAQTAAATCRASVAEARAELAGIERERRLKAERRQSAERDAERWRARSVGTDDQIAALGARLATCRQELQDLAELPDMLAAERDKLAAGIETAERERQAAADKLAATETALRAAALALRTAQQAVATEREARARAETRLESARTRRQEEARKIREQLGVAPEACLALAEAPPDRPLPTLAETDRNLTRLRADRERLGGVNLQADEELSRISEQHQALERERADVEQAVLKLRGAIGQLNREAKKRLTEAFERVNTYFQQLFMTLFNGGEARLEMIEGDDPLQGGLEIIAKPPGKKPATLSLLSGGEQTLTALSLIFAVFLTNPSPICVLDEVDAPLDDANVDRFCTLMEKMAADTATRFLVITHHPMTMTRMNRLFGVTMAEKGISQLVSVDLETAQRFREAG
jgi:chromosome segregation protein